MKRDEQRARMRVEVDAMPITQATKTSLQNQLLRKLEKMTKHMVHFMKPVAVMYDRSVAMQYHSVIAKPMDMSTLRENLDAGVYTTHAQFFADLDLIFQNALTYNGGSTEHTSLLVCKSAQHMMKEVDVMRAELCLYIKVAAESEVVDREIVGKRTEEQERQRAEKRQTGQLLMSKTAAEGALTSIMHAVREQQLPRVKDVAPHLLILEDMLDGEVLDLHEEYRAEVSRIERE
ncbi:hypothetical protein EON66_08525, partial [archaeon]